MKRKATLKKIGRIPPLSRIVSGGERGVEGISVGGDGRVGVGLTGEVI